MATSGSSGSSGGGGGGGSAGKAAGLATPEASGSSETLEDDQPPQGSAEGKRKKFHPLRAVRKIFRWKAKRQGSQEVVGPSKKSRSTGELQSVPDEDQRPAASPACPAAVEQRTREPQLSVRARAASHTAGDAWNTDAQVFADLPAGLRRLAYATAVEESGGRTRGLADRAPKRPPRDAAKAVQLRPVHEVPRQQY
ncbi:uncharacterized protein ISCGN_028330 [Ixodes scapularis]